MKNYQLTLHTTSLFDLLKDIKNVRRETGFGRNF